MTEQSAEPEKKALKGWSTTTKVLIGFIILVFIISFAVIFTLTIAVLEMQPGNSFPYSTNYRVSLPDGEPVTIGNSRIIVMAMGDEVDTSVDGNKEKLVVGQERFINPHFARISILGLPLIDTDFQITLKYIGASGNNALFDMTVRTSKQIPEFVLRRLLPPNMNAQPI